MASMDDSRARVPLAASSSTVLTVFNKDVTLVTITFAESFSIDIAGSFADFPDAFFVALMSSPSAVATSLTAFIKSTCASGCSDPSDAAPCLTQSASSVMVMTALPAALASCS
ncbi:hypothetical protein NP493_327g01000 [Ridgeia piscesae]|uniref:Uncharacterized protein n=1 Tax=Ridgeia piscesae TaxID=27915 RepID=A0AAD9L447_RIDPI|nr:hypothetical protein NP493_327g01000 [Ridgeia piscesae]